MNRAEARGMVKAEKVRRSESARMAKVVDAKVGGRLERKAVGMMLDESMFEDWRVEKGGDEGALRFLCRQVAEGVRLKTICEHYQISYGLMWDFLSEVPERLERYYRAQRGVADAWVGEVVEIADSEGEVAEKKWRGEARLRVAGKYDRDRFGERESGGVVIDMRDRKSPEELLAEVRALVGGNAELEGRLKGVIEKVVGPVDEVVAEDGNEGELESRLSVDAGEDVA